MPQNHPPEPRKAKLKLPARRSAPPIDFALDDTWRQVLRSEFASSHLDLERWWTRYTHNSGYLDFLNDEEQRYRESANHVQHQGVLKLTAYPRNQEGYYPSGLIRSKDLVPVHNGEAWFIECEAQVPRGRGVWPAFWIASCESVAGDDASALWPPEIDIMEIVNNEAEDTTLMLHCHPQVWNWDSNPQKYQITWWDENYNWEWGTWWAPFDFAEGMHSFGLYYKRPDYTLYCDRKPIAKGVYDWVYDTGAPCPGAYILCNLAIGGSWAGRHGIDDSAFPQALAVRRIAVWMQMPQSTIGHDLVERQD